LKKHYVGGVALVVAATLFSSGCFAYRAAEVGAVPAGEDVRLHLTRQGAADLPELPLGAGSTVRGRVLRNEGDRLLLRVPVAVQRDALSTRELGQDYEVAVSQLELVERREFSAFRTGLAAAAGVGGAAVLLHAFSQLRKEEGADPSGPPVEMIRIPLLSIPVP
jgi:hypothetical protein